MGKKKIAICHYRVGGTDGVSLEIEKRKIILEKHGCEVKLIAGPKSSGADFIVEELEWDDGIIPIIKENGYSYFQKTDLSDNELLNAMYGTADLIERKLTEIQLEERFDAVLIHNIFSFGGHIAAARAFTNWTEKFKLHAIATHHDFHWEREDFKIAKNGFLKKYMEIYMPPKTDHIEHVVINSIAKDELKRRSDIESRVLPDIFDFSQPKWEKDNFNKDFLENFDIKENDLIVLQATRILPRKGIELAIDFVKALQKNVEKLRGKILYNGKILLPDSNVTLIIAGYAEDEKRSYLHKLETKIFEDNIHAKFISNNVRAKRSINENVKTYSLWDAYVHADLITFPSLWEGWGNQFIEAVFAKKPVAMFEYPVFEKDIAPEGFDIISLGNKTLPKDDKALYKLSEKNLNEAVTETTTCLTNSSLNKTLERNFFLGKKFHDYKILEDFLVEELELL